MENLKQLILKKNKPLEITHADTKGHFLYSLKLNGKEIAVESKEKRIYWYAIVASFIKAMNIEHAQLQEINVKDVYPEIGSEEIVNRQKSFKNIIGIFSSEQEVLTKIKEKNSDSGIKIKYSQTSPNIYYACFTASDSIQLLQGLLNVYGNEIDEIEMLYAHKNQDKGVFDEVSDEESKEISNISLNTIIYGPPGTGKTHSIKSTFYDKLIVNDISESNISHLNWLDTVLLAFKEYDFSPLNWNEIYESKILREYKEIKNSIDYKATTRAAVYKNASKEGFIGYFKKNDTKWGITDKGIELANKINIDIDGKDEVDNFEMVTFHQSFGYEEFIEGIKAKTMNGQIQYSIEDGIFVKFCKRAKQSQELGENKNYLFVIDEINRANISKVFGELITLIEDDKRIKYIDNKWSGSMVTLPYSGTKFGVPDNVYIVGTMNTADKSIAMIDSALRRRFDFIELMPSAKVLANILDNSGIIEGVNIPRIMTLLNERIMALYDRDHTLGHALFINISSLEDLQKVFQNKVIPLLQDYFYGDLVKIKAILNDKHDVFVKRKQFKVQLFDSSLIENLYDIESQYDLVTEVDYEEFLKFIHNFSNEYVYDEQNNHR
ncbi:McrB family protein [Macrococcus armenti]|uniref:McrB family protein n=1 Tax=Macrococcus armenti TaxID=2875764 RepID=UPI001CC97748|nr:Mlp family lipoprotein [Macrococcus armenti]UBH15791.1 AAA family ATPase [Macrococcus armenti]UBH18150.1 AAA family ATPase [Macrococcus armenti]UBH20417.1 AAA family ATPase [Macrococcus armenti]